MSFFRIQNGQKQEDVSVEILLTETGKSVGDSFKDIAIEDYSEYKYLVVVLATNADYLDVFPNPASSTDNITPVAENNYPIKCFLTTVEDFFNGSELNATLANGGKRTTTSGGGYRDATQFEAVVRRKANDYTHIQLRVDFLYGSTKLGIRVYGIK